MINGGLYSIRSGLINPNKYNFSFHGWVPRGSGQCGLFQREGTDRIHTNYRKGMQILRDGNGVPSLYCEQNKQ